MSSIYEYPVEVKWQAGREGSGEVLALRSDTCNHLSVPPEFGGPGTGTNPEEMLACAVASCYSITLGIVLANRKLPYISIDVKAKGEVEQNGASFKYKRITLHPTVTLPRDATDSQLEVAKEMATKADPYCIVTNAIRTSVEIVLEPTVLRA